MRAWPLGSEVTYAHTIITMLPPLNDSPIHAHVHADSPFQVWTLGRAQWPQAGPWLHPSAWCPREAAWGSRGHFLLGPERADRLLTQSPTSCWNPPSPRRRTERWWRGEWCHLPHPQLLRGEKKTQEKRGKEIKTVSGRQQRRTNETEVQIIHPSLSQSIVIP